MNQYKLLIIEDDTDLREGLSFSFPVMDTILQKWDPKGKA